MTTFSPHCRGTKVIGGDTQASMLLERKPMKVSHKSQEQLKLFIAILCDAQSLHSEVFTLRALRLTTRKVEKRFAREGMGLLTKALPRLGKLFDRALSGECPLDSSQAAFKSSPSSKLPMFMGELFRCVFSHDGWILPTPCVKCIKTIRTVLYSYNKYELSYDPEAEEKVIATFEGTERDLEAVESRLKHLSTPKGCQRCGLTFSSLRGWNEAGSDNVDLACLERDERVPERERRNTGYSPALRSSDVQAGEALHGSPCSFSASGGPCGPTRTQESQAQARRLTARGGLLGSPGALEREPLGSNDIPRGEILKGLRSTYARLEESLQLSDNWRADHNRYPAIKWAGPKPVHACRCGVSCESHDRATESRNPGSRAYSQYVRSSGDLEAVVYRARLYLSRLFRAFDVRDIYPRHGPGAVSTKEQLQAKYQWTRVSRRITDSYPLDEYFFVNLDHVCDRLQELKALSSDDAPARVCLVPKDSRGPRLISCEPVDFQWIQQGLGRAIVKHVESHPMTKWNVHFTDQQPNQFGALLGSSTGKYATLDLSEASDRVSCELVRLLFPEPLLTALMNCRTLGTVLPSGKYLALRKFAPMGSSLCFPILALTIWAVLTAATPDADTRFGSSKPSGQEETLGPAFQSETQAGILVYGDDVVVPTAYAERATSILEAVGLKVNVAKSFSSGFFRESCGVDAFNGVVVTPIRIRTVWTHHRSPEAYESWIAYANQFYDRQMYNAYSLIAEWIFSVYGRVPETSQIPDYPEREKERSRQKWYERNLVEFCPALRYVSPEHRPNRWRINHAFQKKEWLCRTVKPRSVKREIDGWSMLLRFFAEAGNQRSPSPTTDVAAQMQRDATRPLEWERSVLRVGRYTKRRESMLSWSWR